MKGLVFAFTLLTATALADDPIGKAARAWRLDHWMNSAPLQLKELRGKVVLVRWWTAPGCPYCAATAPALNRLHADFGAKGLTVIGAYHHKSPAPFTPADVASRAAEFGFKFPIAIDTDWQTVNDWWLNSGDQRWTSVSFLIDRHGRVRHIHEGGEYPLGSEDYHQLRQKIEELLQER
jgi:thiol-disulfide isomerase/thioredoxin